MNELFRLRSQQSMDTSRIRKQFDHSFDVKKNSTREYFGKKTDEYISKIISLHFFTSSKNALGVKKYTEDREKDMRRMRIQRKGKIDVEKMERWIVR